MSFEVLRSFDPEVYQLINEEEHKQQTKLSLIASENFTRRAVREALSSVFVHKYAEGQVGKRYYEGNQYVDELEGLCMRRAREVFALPPGWQANVQALSGSNANLAVYNGLLTPGDVILSMYLPDGGHLSHGWSLPEDSENGLQGQVGQQVYLGGARKTSIVSKIFRVVQYKVDPATRVFNYDVIRQIAREYRPKMIVSGGTAYPRQINHAALGAIAADVGAYYLADVSHEAGLIAAGANPSPVGLADVVTFTTQKTLRGPRGAIILGRSDLMDRVALGVFPGLQGGPFEHTIASIAVALKDAATPEFKQYGHQTVANARCLAACMMDAGFDVVTGGTDKHLVLIDLRSKGMGGRNLAVALDRAGIILNRNSVPNETGSPMNPSGIRMGTPTVTTRGMGEAEMAAIAGWIDRVVTVVTPMANLRPRDFRSAVADLPELGGIAQEVQNLCARFPLDI